MNRLSVRLTLAIVATTLLAVGVVALLANRATGSEFRRYLAAGQMASAQSLAPELAAYYGAQGSWNGVTDWLEGAVDLPGRGQGGRGSGGARTLQLADSAGEILYDSAGISTGGFMNRDQQDLAISIEVRKPKGEGYSTLKGFFRQYELVYIVADERDLIRLRTNYRRDPPEDVYVYRTRSSIEAKRRLFLEYMRRINALQTQPEFYNTLTTNCTNSLWTNSQVNPGRVPLSWKILVSGYVPTCTSKGGWRRRACRSRNCTNGPTSTRAPRPPTRRPISRGEFAPAASVRCRGHWA